VVFDSICIGNFGISFDYHRGMKLKDNAFDRISKLLHLIKESKRDVKHKFTRTVLMNK